MLGSEKDYTTNRFTAINIYANRCLKSAEVNKSLLLLQIPLIP